MDADESDGLIAAESDGLIGLIAAESDGLWMQLVVMD